MTVREVLENLNTLPLDCDIFIRFDSGEYIQDFPIDTIKDCDEGLIIFSHSLDDTIQNDFIKGVEKL
jgi:hypothetical protein